MKLRKVFIEKILMLKDNPKILLNWGYKIGNLFKENVLNHGERYDPNILKKFNINDAHQEGRYHFAKSLISDNETVLDIACGTGYGTQLLAEKCSEIIGYDISKIAIEYANKHYKSKSNISFKQSDIFSITDYADVVVSFETIEHIKGNIQDVILKLLSLANKKLICSVPYQEASGVNKYHVHSNINESAFILPSNLYDVEFFYQPQDGTLSSVKNNNETFSLVVIIRKKTFNFFEFFSKTR